jgi:peptidoglycan hydrolase-like protein with peptidoglycan-binding domain
MKGRLAIAVAVVSMASAGALLAQQAPTKPAAKPAATQAAPTAPAAQAQQAKPAAKPAAPKWTSDQIKEAQEGLKRAKVYTGPVNGTLGPATRRAIRAFQKAHQMKQDGELSDSLITALKAVP